MTRPDLFPLVILCCISALAVAVIIVTAIRRDRLRREENPNPFGFDKKDLL